MKERKYEVVEKIYDFDELTEEAKENARQIYLDQFKSADDYETFCVDDLANNHFEHSDLNVQFSLSSCQGDGFNIYGKVELSDAIDFVLHKTSNFDNKTIRFFKWLKTLGYKLELPSNHHYCYCIIDSCDFANDIQWLLEQDGYTSNSENHFSMLCNFDTEFKRYVEKLCKEYEQDGYKYFYEVEDSEIKEVWEISEYEGFYEDGSPCYS